MKEFDYFEFIIQRLLDNEIVIQKDLVTEDELEYIRLC